MRKAPRHLQESVVEDVNAVTPTRKIKVKCNQTGKVLNVMLSSLLKESGEQLTRNDLNHGTTVLFESSNGEAYDVSICQEKDKITADRSLRTADQLEEEKTPLDDDDDDNVEKIVKTRKRKRVETILTDELDDYDDDEPLRRKVSKPSVSKTFSAMAVDELNFDDNIMDNGAMKRIKLCDNDRPELLISMDRKMNTILALLKKLNQSSHSNDKSIVSEDMDENKYSWNGINLLNVQGKDVYSYGRNLLDVLFTKGEQKQSVLFPTKKSNKPPLDPERVTLLQDCIKSKYNSEYKYSILLQTLNQKCRDAKI